MDYIEMGEYLKKIRKKNTLTLQVLADRTGYSNAYISMVENGHKKNPSVDFLGKLAKTLEMTSDDIRVISNFYDIPYVSLMAEAGYLNEQGAVPVDSFFEAFHVKPSDMEDMKKNGGLIAYGSDELRPFKRTNEAETKAIADNFEKNLVDVRDLYDMDIDIDVYSLLKNKSKLYYKSKQLNKDDKDFLMNFLKRTFDNKGDN